MYEQITGQSYLKGASPLWKRCRRTAAKLIPPTPARWADWRTGIIACRATGSDLIQINQLFLSGGCGLAVVLGLSVRERVWIQLEELESGQSAGRLGAETFEQLAGKTREFLPAREARRERAQLALGPAGDLNPRASRVCVKTFLAVM